MNTGAPTVADFTVKVTVYEPGVYKGEKDPLLAMHAKPEHKAQLQERFTKGQAER